MNEDLKNVIRVALTSAEQKMLNDYITNLQRKYDMALEDNVKESKRRMELQEENERLLESNDTLSYRIYEAIEYNKKVLKENWYGGNEKENSTKTINILQGGDKEC